VVRKCVLHLVSRSCVFSNPPQSYCVGPPIRLPPPPLPNLPFIWSQCFLPYFNSYGFPLLILVVLVERFLSETFSPLLLHYRFPLLGIILPSRSSPLRHQSAVATGAAWTHLYFIIIRLLFSEMRHLLVSDGICRSRALLALFFYFERGVIWRSPLSIPSFIVTRGSF